jgi:hypothetical protein
MVIIILSFGLTLRRIKGQMLRGGQFEVLRLRCRAVSQDVNAVHDNVSIVLFLADFMYLCFFFCPSVGTSFPTRRHFRHPEEGTISMLMHYVSLPPPTSTIITTAIALRRIVSHHLQIHAEVQFQCKVYRLASIENLWRLLMPSPTG